MNVSLRNLCGWLFARVLIAGGFVNRASQRAMKGEFILSVYFHKPSKEEFEACVKWLKKNKYTFLSVSDLDQIVKLGLPFPKGAAILTADDGWLTNEANIVEVANKHQVPVTIFVSTSPVEDGAYWWSYLLEARKRNIDCPPVKALKQMPESKRLVQVEKIKKKLLLEREAMTVEQISRIACSEYVTIGAHTHSHPILVNCSETQVYYELDLSRAKLESWIGKEVSSFAYPNGDYSEREIEALRKLNYKVAFCSDPRPLTPDCLTSMHVLPRFGLLEGASYAENICRLVGVWHPTIHKLKSPFRKKGAKETNHTPTIETGKKLVVSE